MKISFSPKYYKSSTRSSIDLLLWEYMGPLISLDLSMAPEWEEYKSLPYFMGQKSLPNFNLNLYGGFILIEVFGSLRFLHRKRNPLK